MGFSAFLGLGAALGLAAGFSAFLGLGAALGLAGAFSFLAGCGAQVTQVQHRAGSH